MRLADWIRVSLWSESDWRRALHALVAVVTGDSTSTAARVSDLADACELIEPERRHALALHELAWRLGGGPAPLARAFELAREVGDHDAIATLALTAFDATQDASHLVTAAMAYLDSARPPLALAPLAAALEARPKDDEVRSALAMVRKTVRDPQAEVSSWVARAARVTGAESGRLYLHAARLARLAGLDAIFVRHVETAWQRGRDPAAAMLIEADLIAKRRANDLLAFYRGRVEAAGSDREWADHMRAAGTKLVLSNVQRGLALRMLRSGLEAAYRARLDDIPGHLASWDLLIRHAREARSMRELMPLVVEAMGQPLTDDARLYLARFGFDVTWREATDQDAARPYAAAIAELVPGDSALHEFVSTSMPALTETTYEPPAAPLPPEPSFIKMRTPSRTLPPAALDALRAGNRKPGLPTSPPVPTQASRIAERVVVPADVEVRVDGEAFAAIVRDLSATGVYIVTERELPIDAVVTIAIDLPDVAMLASTRFEVGARVVRRAYTGYGLLLIEPPRALVDAISALTAAK